MTIEYPGISVIIPLYNREKYIADAIDSILSQNYSGNLEIIISDDGSTDKSIDIVLEYNDDRINLLRKEPNCITQGAASARNRGICAATQPYICFLDSDDYQLPGFLNTMIEGLQLNKDCDFAFCRSLERIEDATETMIVPWTKKIITSMDVKYVGLTRNNIITTNTFIFRKSIFDEIVTFNEKYSNSEDTDLWIRIGEKYKCTFIDFVGAVRRKHEGEQLTKNELIRINSCIINIYENALKRNPKNSFRIYKLKFRILSLKKQHKKIIKLIMTYPISALKHFFLVSINQMDFLLRK